MPHQRGFTLAELAAVVVILAALMALLIPALKDSRRTASSAQTSTHVRGIHSGLVFYGQGNKDWYPGLDATGARATLPIAGVAGQSYGTNSTDGYDPAYRYAVLLRGKYFSPEYMKSPNETNTAKRAPNMGESMDSSHFSYAMLRLSGPGTGVRRDQWRANLNDALAPVVSDRNLGPAGAPASIHSPTGWRGYVCYNDNHAVFESGNILKTTLTAYTPGKPNTPQQFTTTRDDLFADDNDDAGNAGNDAAMVYQDADVYVDQK